MAAFLKISIQQYGKHQRNSIELIVSLQYLPLIVMPAYVQLMMKLPSIKRSLYILKATPWQQGYRWLFAKQGQINVAHCVWYISVYKRKARRSAWLPQKLLCAASCGSSLGPILNTANVVRSARFFMKL